jgi:hypothetical protein
MALIAVGIVLIFPAIRYPFAVAPGKPHPPPAIETFAALMVMTYSVFAMVWRSWRTARERIGEIAPTPSCSPSGRRRCG